MGEEASTGNTWHPTRIARSTGDRHWAADTANRSLGFWGLAQLQQYIGGKEGKGAGVVLEIHMDNDGP